jgi:hypothetical protein
MSDSLIGLICISAGLNIALLAFCVSVCTKCDRLEREISQRIRWQEKEIHQWRERL